MFSVGHNFDENLIEQIKDHDIYEVYGKLTYDIIGGCRDPFSLKNITKNKLKREVSKAHQYHIEFNYLLNSTCLGNVEYSRSGLKKIFKLLDFLKSIEVDTLTVANPYLAQLIKKNYHNFKIDVSTLSGVNTIKKFQSWLQLGADSITLDVSANRDFNLLRHITKINPQSVKLMVNQCCENDCIYYNYHANINSHQSQKKKSLPLEYCSFNCKYRRTKDSSILLRAPWIRPEDISIYQKLGFNKFKIVQRQDTTEKIVRSVRAYYYGSYSGNLLDIMNFVYNLKNKNFKIVDYKKYFSYFFKPTAINLLKTYKLSKVLGDDYGLYIDNGKLDGFLKYFIDGHCLNVACDQCNYCHDWAQKVISFDKKRHKQLIEKYKNITDLFIDKKNNLFL